VAVQIEKKKRMRKSAGRAPSKNASFTLAFALQLRKTHGKTSVRVWKTSVRLRKPQSYATFTPFKKHGSHSYTLIKLAFNVVNSFTKLFGTTRSIRKVKMQRHCLEIICNRATIAALYKCKEQSHKTGHDNRARTNDVTVWDRALCSLQEIGNGFLVE
jgi:hypothetical protein